MATPAIDAPAAHSVTGPLIYHREDYIGAVRHLVIFIVDFLVLSIASVPVSAIYSVRGDSTFSSSIVAMLYCVFAWSYLTLLKRSRFRTPGYWIAGAKIITIDGQSPSVLRMTLRLAWTLMWFLGPLSFFVDFFWTTIDDERQMLRDLFLETRLVRNRARPSGPGAISLACYTAFGSLTVFYRQVRPSKAIAASAAPAASSLECAAVEPRETAPESGSGESEDAWIVPCPECGMRVVPKAGGCCPSCQSQITKDA